MKRSHKIAAALAALCLLCTLLVGCTARQDALGSADPNGDAAPVPAEGEASAAATEAPAPVGPSPAEQMQLLGVYHFDSVTGELLYKTSFSYDADGRVTQMRESEQAGDTAYTIVYDEAGRPIEQRLDDSALESEGAGGERYRYDDAGRLAEVSGENFYESWTQTITRDDSGTIAAVTRTSQRTGFLSSSETDEPIVYRYTIRPEDDGGVTVAVTLDSDPASEAVQRYDADGVKVGERSEPADAAYPFDTAFWIYEMDRNGLPGVCQTYAPYMLARGRWIDSTLDWSGDPNTWSFTRMLEPVQVWPESNPEKPLLIYGSPGMDADAVYESTHI